MTPTKRCYTCKEIKPRTAEFFKRDRSKPDGLHAKCSQCERVWTREVYRPRVGRAKDIERARQRRQEKRQKEVQEQ